MPSCVQNHFMGKLLFAFIETYTSNSATVTKRIAFYSMATHLIPNITATMSAGKLKLTLTTFILIESISVFIIFFRTQHFLRAQWISITTTCRTTDELIWIFSCLSITITSIRWPFSLLKLEMKKNRDNAIEWFWRKAFRSLLFVPRSGQRVLEKNFAIQRINWIDEWEWRGAGKKNETKFIGRISVWFQLCQGKNFLCKFYWKWWKRKWCWKISLRIVCSVNERGLMEFESLFFLAVRECRIKQKDRKERNSTQVQVNLLCFCSFSILNEKKSFFFHSFTRFHSNWIRIWAFLFAQLLASKIITFVPMPAKAKMCRNVYFFLFVYVRSRKFRFTCRTNERISW